MCTITGPAAAVIGPLTSGAKLFSIHASPRLLDSSAPVAAVTENNLARRDIDLLDIGVQLQFDAMLGIEVVRFKRNPFLWSASCEIIL